MDLVLVTPRILDQNKLIPHR